MSLYTASSMSGPAPLNLVKPDATISIKAQNAFGLHLLNELTTQTFRENVFISPTSVFMGLLLAELGAFGKTGDAIRQTLYVPAGISSAELRQSAGAHARQLRSCDSVQLSVVSALWADKRLPLDTSSPPKPANSTRPRRARSTSPTPGRPRPSMRGCAGRPRICSMA